MFLYPQSKCYIYLILSTVETFVLSEHICAWGVEDSSLVRYVQNVMTGQLVWPPQRLDILPCVNWRINPSTPFPCSLAYPSPFRFTSWLWMSLVTNLASTTLKIVFLPPPRE